MQKKVLATTLGLLTLVLAACGGQAGPAQTTEGQPQGEPVQTANGTYFNIDINQVKALLDDDSAFTVNVHIPYAGEMPGTDALIPFNEVAQRADAFPTDKNTPLVLYCRSGSMSAEAAEALVGLGYTKVFNVTGGMNAWQRAGNRLLQR